MISLISRWKLRDGCTPELLDGIRKAVADVERCETGTLMYSVHLPALNPLAATGRSGTTPPPIPPGNQPEVVFFEIYKDADAFAAHLGGAAFQNFVHRYLHCFYIDPTNPKMPLADTSYLDRQAAFIRPEAEDQQLAKETVP